MKKLVLLLFFTLLIISCNKGWENIVEGTDPEGGKFIIAIDRSDITEMEDMKTAWVRKTFTNPKKLKNGDTYRETFIYFGVNCQDKKYSIIQIEMSNPGSNDFVHTVSFEDENDQPVWKDIPEGEPSRKIYKEICK